VNLHQVYDERAWRVMAGDVVYATRPTRPEAEEVAETQHAAAAKFGEPVRVEPPLVTELPAP
jgi:hypothetical protein